MEPIFTCSLSRDEVKRFVTLPIEVPNFSIHTQSTERAVKQVTEAAACAVGHEARDGFIRARIHHREEMPKFRSKKDIMKSFHLICIQNNCSSFVIYPITGKPVLLIQSYLC